jgi:phenylacetate-CoA oxygenase PaaH subunit
MTDRLPKIFEVFLQRRPGEAFVHVGEVEAPAPAVAMHFAKEHFLRREPAVGVWVVDRNDVTATAWAPEILSSGRFKRYRRTLGRAVKVDVFASDSSVIERDETERDDEEHAAL